MPHILSVSVRLHDGRYHGAGEAEPSPARVFQALIAAAARSGGVERFRAAFEWLEGLKPPVIALPAFRFGQSVANFVPNNDVDAVGGDLSRTPEIRVEKVVRPRIFDASLPFVFGWWFNDAGLKYAQEICAIAERVYQFGRGIDLAWAIAELLDPEAFEQRLREYPGRVLRPSGPGTESDLPCPTEGSFESLERRFHAAQVRLRRTSGDPRRELLVQPPKPHFRREAYGEATVWHVFQLEADREPASVSLGKTVALARAARDGAAARLRSALQEQAEDVRLTIIGRQRDEPRLPSDPPRLVVLPLPSIGHDEADRRIRRVAVGVPRAGPIAEGDFLWAFSGLEFPIEGLAMTLVTAWNDSILRHYRGEAKRWTSVTPIAVPAPAGRRRIEPSRAREEAKPGTERIQEEERAIAAVADAVRHAGIREQVKEIRVQREPFSKRGSRAEDFADSERFPKERLWHAEVEFTAGVPGPLLLGDGRFFGLGVLQPKRAELGTHVFEIESGLRARPDPIWLARALRRAVMARVQTELGNGRRLPPFFSGHDEEDIPGTSPHLHYGVDMERRRLLVYAPPREGGTREDLEILSAALDGFVELKAGGLGLLALRATRVDRSVDPLFGQSRTWTSLTRYRVNRHAKTGRAKEALIEDLKAECLLRRLPEPKVFITNIVGVRGGGLEGRVLLSFENPVVGPLALGRTRHVGGGLFRRA